METSTFYGRSKSVESSSGETSRETTTSPVLEEQPSTSDVRPTLVEKVVARPSKTLGIARQSSSTEAIPSSSSCHIQRGVTESPGPILVKSSSQGSSSSNTSQADRASIEVGDLDSDDDDSSKVPKGRRKKGSQTERHFLFTVEVEDELIDWWRQNPYLYNNTLPEFLDKGKKDRAYTAKAYQIGCTSEYIIKIKKKHFIKQ